MVNLKARRMLRQSRVSSISLGYALAIIVKPPVRYLKYGRVKLSVMCVLLCIQLWATTTSFLLPKGTLKLHAHPLVLLLTIAGLVQVDFDDRTRGHLIPRLISSPGEHIAVYVSSHRVPR